jgi:hypothetical protein
MCLDWADSFAQGGQVAYGTSYVRPDGPDYGDSGAVVTAILKLLEPG